MSEEDYTNPGFGTVLGVDASKLEQAERMFRQQARWSNRELNDILGWQFSQVIFYLRQRGMNIVTIHVGGRRFDSELRPGRYIPKTRRRDTDAAR